MLVLAKTSHLVYLDGGFPLNISHEIILLQAVGTLDDLRSYLGLLSLSFSHILPRFIQSMLLVSLHEVVLIGLLLAHRSIDLRRLHWYINVKFRLFLLLSSR